VGYDFYFWRQSDGPQQFPSELPADYGPGNLGSLGDPDLLLKRLTSRENSSPNGHHPYECRWDTPDGGDITFTVWTPRTSTVIHPGDKPATAHQGDWINVDTRAHWRYVLQAYQYLSSLYPDLVIVDPQQATLHDARSFAAFIEQDYGEPP